MRIVSWNIRAGGGVRAELIAKQLCRWRGDVVALQEFRATPPSRRLAEALATQGLTHQETTIDRALPAANRLLVASRCPLELMRSRSAPREPGRWLLVRVLAQPGLIVGAMHAPNRVSGRKYPLLDAVHSLARSWRDGPALFAGDTNSGRIGLDEEAPAFNQREDRWMQALDDAGWHDAYRRIHGDKRVYTWYSPNGRNGFRLDQAFVNRSLLPRLTAARYRWGRVSGDGRREALSDHAALIVDFD